MLQMFHMNSYEFKNESDCEFLYILNYKLETETEKKTTIKDFQNLFEHNRFCFVKSDFGLAKEVNHFKAIPMKNIKFYKCYNEYINHLKDRPQGINFIPKNYIVKSYCLYERFIGGDSLCVNLVAIAETKDGFLGFQYMFTA